MADINDTLSSLSTNGISSAFADAGLLDIALNLATKNLLGETVAIVDSATFLPVFYGAEPMRVRVRESARVMQHPLETGVTISDHHVIEPREFEVDLIIPAVYYISVYQQIRTAMVNAELLILQSNADVYTNLIVADMPHEESPQMTGVLAMSLRLKEILFVAPASITTQNTSNPSSVPSNYAPSDPTDSNTVLRGQCTLQDSAGNGSNIPAVSPPAAFYRSGVLG